MTSGRLTECNQEVINECVRLISLGATQRTCARKLGLSDQTLTDWKKKGRETDDPINIYRIFLVAIEQAFADWELIQVSQVDDHKWLLVHHPSTKDDWAEKTISKQEIQQKTDISLSDDLVEFIQNHGEVVIKELERRRIKVRQIHDVPLNNNEYEVNIG
ncbi:MAG: hypothetical protein WCE94_15715 [Candidatus Methanoperedens sp.]